MLDKSLRKKLRRDTVIVTIAVIIMTGLVIRVSYAYIFSVKSKATLHQIASGVLNLTINQLGSTAMSTDDLYPVDSTLLPTASNSVYTGDYARLSLNNNGTITSHFLVNIGYDALPSGSTQSDLTSFAYLLIGVFSEEDNAWINLGTTQSPAYYKTINTLNASGTNIYDVFEDEVDASDAKNYRVYIWLDEDTPITEIEKLVYLKVNVVSTTVNGRIEG